MSNAINFVAQAIGEAALILPIIEDQSDHKSELTACMGGLSFACRHRCPKRNAYLHARVDDRNWGTVRRLEAFIVHDDFVQTSECRAADRKRDGVETLLTVEGARLGFGRGEIAAGLSNWRSIANILSPVRAAHCPDWQNPYPVLVFAWFASSAESTFSAPDESL